MIIGRYSVIEKLGEGSFGTVVKAHDSRLKRIVAVKILKRVAMVSYPDRVREIEERFTREAEAGARIGDHPNVVNVFDLVVDDERTMYLILEFVAGGTLARRIQDGQIPVATALRWTADAARGLNAAHDAGIVHRDVKPANIYIGNNGRAMVGDFGIAQIDTLSRRTSMATSHPGTPLYMSPEQTQSTGYVRPSSDQYSLGLVLFEMLAGQPYKRFEPDQAAMLLDYQPSPISHLIRRMIEAKPEHRYRSMADVVTAIEAIERTLAAIASGETILPPQVGQAEGPRASGPRGDAPTAPPRSLALSPRETDHHAPSSLHRRAVLVAFGGLVATTASGGLWLGRRSGMGRPAVNAPAAATGASLGTALPASGTVPVAAISTVPVNTPPPPVAAVATSAPTPTTPPANGSVLFSLSGHTDSVVGIAFAPDGQTLATGSLDNTARIWRASDGTSQHGSLNHPGAVRSVAFSADGMLLATGAADSQVRLWRTSNGGLDRTLPGHAGPVISVVFSPDGKTVASGSADKTIKLWRVNDGTPIKTITGHVDSIFGIAFSPDGQAIASGSADKTIKLWRVSDGTLIQNFQGHTDNVNGVAFAPDGKTLASVSSDKKAIIWNVSDGKTIHEHLTHPGVVYTVAFAPDGRSMVTGSDDKTVRVWRVVDGGQSGALDRHTGSVRGVAFSSDGKMLATASVDKTALLWRLQ